MTTKQYIAFLMDLSDAVAKARKEMEGMIAAHRALSVDEHEAIKNMLLGIQSDAGVADVERFANYERVTKEVFAGDITIKQ